MSPRSSLSPHQLALAVFRIVNRQRLTSPPVDAGPASHASLFLYTSDVPLPAFLGPLHAAPPEPSLGSGNVPGVLPFAAFILPAWLQDVSVSRKPTCRFLKPQPRPIFVGGSTVPIFPRVAIRITSGHPSAPTAKTANHRGFIAASGSPPCRQSARPGSSLFQPALRGCLGLCLSQVFGRRVAHRRELEIRIDRRPPDHRFRVQSALKVSSDAPSGSPALRLSPSVPKILFVRRPFPASS